MMENRRYIPPIIVALVVAILPHLGRLPFWIIAWCAFMWGFLLLSIRSGWPRPGKWLSRVLSVIGLIGVFLTYGQSFGPNAFMGLLAVMAAIKPFEIRTHRDRVIVIFLAYFIVITGLFLSESLIMTGYMLISVFVTTTALIRINQISGSFRNDLKLAGLIVGQAIPLMAVLFLVFPRIPGSFFGLSRLYTARTGFSDVLRPGSVARLVEDKAIAFRVTFDEPAPPAEKRYWRGIVFERFDGRQWYAAKGTPLLRDYPAGDDRVSYTVNLEPHNQRWLFALDLPLEAPRWTNLRADYTLRTVRPVRQKIRYRMTSLIDYRTRGTSRMIEPALQLPPDGNPLARDLARQLAGNAGSAVEKAERIMAYFKSRNFVYTLQPPPLGDHPVDDFFTRTRSGYCEHYASAFAFMMRALDVPARVVGGYLGGEINPYGNYLLIRQSHAHVWVEIWQEDLGWRRVDPTTAVMPDRISTGMASALSRETGKRPLAAFFNRLKLRWDAVSTAWEEWFTGYSHEEQQALLDRLGLAWQGWTRTARLLGLVLAIVTLFAVGYSIYFFLPGRKTEDKITRGYRQFLKKMTRAGFHKQPAQAAGDFAREICLKRPDLAETVNEITRLYVRLRFQKEAEENTLSRFQKAIRVFTP